MGKGKAPAFQLYASDFDMDTASWDNEEVGVYFRLLMYQWVNKSIPDDTKRLAKIVRIGEKRFKKSWRIVSDKFQNNGENGLANPRMERTRQEQDNYRKSQSEAGMRGIEKKKKEGIFPFDKVSDPLSNPSSDPPSEIQALQSSSSSSSSKKKKEIKKGVDYPDFLNLELWKEFKKFRTAIKAKMTPHSEKINITELQKLIDQGEDQEAVINQTISRGWKGFFPVKDNGRNLTKIYTDAKRYLDSSEDNFLKFCKLNEVNPTEAKKWIQQHLK